jgi:hypothetical protein
MTYFWIFVQSNLLEAPVMIPFLMKRNTFFQSLAILTCLNAITHPVVFFFMMNLKMVFLFNILTAEVFAIVTEAYALFKITGDPYLNCLFISLAANFFSWQISPMITYAFHS